MLEERQMLNVTKVRANVGMSKYRLCKMPRLSFQTLTAIKKGGDVRLSTLYKIANALGVDIKELFE